MRSIKISRGVLMTLVILADYHKSCCFLAIPDYSRTGSGTGRKMKRGGIYVAVFLAFLVLFFLVRKATKSQEFWFLAEFQSLSAVEQAIEEKFVPVAVERSSLWFLFSCSRSPKSKNKSFWGRSQIFPKYFVLLMPDCDKTRIRLTPGFYFVLSNT